VTSLTMKHYGKEIYEDGRIWLGRNVNCTNVGDLEAMEQCGV